jgi:hypothetical protein
MFKLDLGNENLFSIYPDEFNNGAFFIIIKNKNYILSQLHLVPLWNRLPQFEVGDYYQKSFNSHPPHRGYGMLLINTLLENIREEIPNIQNIYSSSWIDANNFDETDFVTDDAYRFWVNLVNNGIGERIEQIARYRILPQNILN